MCRYTEGSELVCQNDKIIEEQKERAVVKYLARLGSKVLNKIENPNAGSGEEGV